MTVCKITINISHPPEMLYIYILQCYFYFPNSYRYWVYMYSFGAAEYLPHNVDNYYYTCVPRRRRQWNSRAPRPLDEFHDWKKKKKKPRLSLTDKTTCAIITRVYYVESTKIKNRVYHYCRVPTIEKKKKTEINMRDYCCRLLLVFNFLSRRNSQNRYFSTCGTDKLSNNMRSVGGSRFIFNISFRNVWRHAKKTSDGLRPARARFRDWSNG